MRKLIGGLLGLCLMAALVPDASARTDARASAQSGSSSRSAASRQASRPVSARPASARASTSRSAAPARTASSRSAVPSRQAAAGRSSRRGTATASRGRSHEVAARGGRSTNSRMAAAVPYGRSAAVPQGRSLRRTAMASCSLRHGRRTCTTTASRGELMRWTGGLAPAAMSQTSCPDGTIATLAVGHNDITRCVPL